MTGLIVLSVFLVSATLTGLLSRSVFGPRILDYPNERSLHTVPVPRTGGLAILAAAVPAVLLLCYLFPVQDRLVWIMAGMSLVALVSFFDDRAGLSPATRLAVQVVAATVLVFGGLVPDWLELPGIRWDWSAWFAVPVTILYVVWMTNLYNFMDGMDGFAAGMSLVGFLTYAALGWHAAEPMFALLSLTFAAAAGGFLLFNFPPARIFMGDVGASSIGFLVAALSLWAACAGIFPLWAGLLVFSPFIVDATVTLLCRLRAGEKIWQAHRSHYYQRLVRLGWGHRKTVLRGYILMIAAGLTAAGSAYVSKTGQWLLIIMWFFIYCGLGWKIRRLEKQGIHSR